MYRRILVPLDGSKLAEQVIPYAEIMGRGLNSSVELFRAFEPVPEQWANEREGLYLDQLTTAVRNDTEHYLNSVRIHSLGGLGSAVSVSAHEGDPAHLIVEEAAEDPDTIIAMATHGRSGVTRWMMGSVTDKVLHATHVPLLVIRARDGEPPPDNVKLDSIIAPLDGSSLAEQSLPHVVSLAKAMDLKVILTRVAPESRESARDYLNEVRDELYQQGVSSAETQVLNGHAAEAIVDFARETDNNLVAMTTHGRTGVGRWILGSVTDRVVRYSGDPVLVIRANSEGH